MEFKRIGSVSGEAGMTADNSAAVAAEYKEAKRFGKVRVGAQNVFFSGLFTTEYADLCDIKWIYKRQEDTQTSVCCGKATFETFFLIAVFADGAEKKQRIEKAEELAGAVEAIRAASPGIDFGFTAELKKKYGKN